MTLETTAPSSPFRPDAEFFDKMGLDYQMAFGHDTGLQDFMKKAVTYFPPSSKVLDIGCGTGSPVASIVAAYGHRVTGIDSAQSMVDLSRKAVPSGTFELADMLEYKPIGKLDVILSILSLFQLSRAEIESMSLKWAEWLLPDGILCIGTMDPEERKHTAEMYHEDKMGLSGIPSLFMGKHGILTLLTQKGWNHMLEAAGFEIIHTESHLFEPPSEAQSDPEPHYFIIARKIR
ncbi:MAG: hypothetical protein Q9165_000739 [Trypethelium subeluteriae]